MWRKMEWWFRWGIDISDSTVFLGMNGYKEACYLGISSNAGHLEMVELFLDYLDI